MLHVTICQDVICGMDVRIVILERRLEGKSCVKTIISKACMVGASIAAETGRVSNLDVASHSNFQKVV